MLLANTCDVAVLSVQHIIYIEYLLKSWKIDHKEGQMSYSNGYLTVGQAGYYYIYGQLYSRDGKPTLYDFFLSINDTPVLKAVKSIINSRRNKATSYLGGVFKITANQKISIRTHYKNLFKFSSTESFFGAFMIHP